MTWYDEDPRQHHRLSHLATRAFVHPDASLKMVVYRYEQLVHQQMLEHTHRVSVGHAYGCDVRLAPHPQLAGRHLTLQCDPQQGWACVDHHTPEGSLINGRRFYDRVSLRPWDELSAGPYTIQLQDVHLPLKPCRFLKTQPNPLHLMLCDAHGELDRMSILSPRPIRVGRASSCDLTIPGTDISRVHLTLRPQGQGWVLEDGGSRNGTKINGVLLDQGVVRVLDQGDVIELGALRLLVSLSIEPIFEQLPFLPESTRGPDPEPNATCPPYTLHMRSAKGVESTLELERRVALIGRDISADVLIQEADVSRHHARLLMLEQTLFLEPCQPHAVVYLNGRRARARCVVRPCDEIFVGSHRVTYRGFPGQRADVVHTQALDVFVQTNASSWTRRTFTQPRVSIGRMPQCDITLKSPKVSRLHAWIEVGPHGWVVVDNQSTNGVMHQGRLIRDRFELEPEATVSIGGFRLRLEPSMLTALQGVNDDQERSDAGHPPRP